MPGHWQDLVVPNKPDFIADLDKASGGQIYGKWLVASQRKFHDSRRL
jgi:hypothetical protein